MEELKNESIKKIRINFMVIFTSMVYTLFKSSKLVSSPLRFSAVQWSHDTKNPLLRKQLIYFNVCIAGCYSHICFILKTCLRLLINSLYISLYIIYYI